MSPLWLRRTTESGPSRHRRRLHYRLTLRLQNYNSYQLAYFNLAESAPTPSLAPPARQLSHSLTDMSPISHATSLSTPSNGVKVEHSVPEKAPKYVCLSQTPSFTDITVSSPTTCFSAQLTQKAPSFYYSRPLFAPEELFAFTDGASAEDFLDSGVVSFLIVHCLPLHRATEAGGIQVETEHYLQFSQL